MTTQTKELLEKVAALPRDQQEEVAEYVRELEARRTGVYHASPDELDAIDRALGARIASPDDIEAAFRSFRRA